MERLYNVNQAADALGIKVRTIRQWIHTGKLKAGKYPVSNRWFVSESEIRRLRNEQRSGELEHSDDNKD